MRYPASEKLEIIRLVEKSHLPFRRTLDKLGIARATFYRWYDLYRLGGIDALEDHTPAPGYVWNRIPDKVRREIIDLALDIPELSPRELAVRFTDTKRYFVSESSVYRLLKTHDLITSPAFIVMKAVPSHRYCVSIAGQRMNLKTKRQPSISCGRPTLPTSRSLAGAGFICPPSSMTSRVTSSLGSCAPR